MCIRDRDREGLYRRIDDRVHVEIDKGLVEETRRLLAQGYSRNLTSMKSLGFRQMAGFLEGEYDFEEAIRRLKRDTRHFAKRQMTWFRKESNIEWLEVSPDETLTKITDRVLDRIDQLLRSVQAEVHFEGQDSPKPTNVGK